MKRKTPHTSFVCTVLNEERSVSDFLKSIAEQTLLPDEIIIVDGGSTDRTVNEIKNYVRIHALPSFRLFKKNGNRAVCRNFGIKKSKHAYILISDAGCLLSKTWVEEIMKPFSDASTDVVSGYYRGKSSTVFQKCQVPYILTMPDKINAENFLPSTRSMAVRKSTWKLAGMFPEQYSHNEDYVFAVSLRSMKARMRFAKRAIVYWLPRTSLKSVFVMFFRFALGDAEAGILRKKVLLIFVRYIFFVILVSLAISEDFWTKTIVILLVLLYFFWAVTKNYRYVNNTMAYVYLPLLQVLSDFAVLVGTTVGIIRLTVSRL